MSRSSLVGGPRITGDQARQVSFPSAVLGGYRVADVEVFRSRAANEIDTVHRALADMRTEQEELVQQINQLTAELDRYRNDPRAARAADNGQRAIDILNVAQQHADKLVGQAQEEARGIVNSARHDHDQMTEHARQQAARIISQAQQEGQAEKARIIDSATAESRLQADFYAGLAKAMCDGLGGQVKDLVSRLAEWEKLAHEGAAPAPAKA